eukprot:Sspe_Gene.52075::Locus_28869_Transcript_1_1_Confidence_1.000_Length_2993::g.52075::m.52075
MADGDTPPEPLTKGPSFRNLAESTTAPKKSQSMSIASGTSKIHYLVAKEAELKNREAAVAEAEAMMEEVQLLKEESERHAQELMLREASLRERERLHGALDDRDRHIREIEEHLAKWEAELEVKAADIAAKEDGLKRESETRMKQYEELVRPLADREIACLEQEEGLAREKEELKAVVKKEEERVFRLNDVLREREESSKAIQRAAIETRTKLQKQEAEIERAKEELAESVKANKKRAEDLDARLRTIEWKERQLEMDMQRYRERDFAVQKQADDVERARELYQQHEAELRQRNAEVEEMRCYVQSKVQQLLAAEEEVRLKEMSIASTDSSLKKAREEAEKRMEACREYEAQLREVEKGVKTRLADVERREEKVAKREDEEKRRLKQIHDAERELLEWMKQTEYREQQIERRTTGDNHWVLPPQLDHAPRHVPVDPEAIVSVQLQAMKNTYLGAMSRKRAQKERESVQPGKKERPDIFQLTLDETKQLHALEKDVKEVAGSFAKYLVKIRVLDSHTDLLPLGKDNRGLPEDEVALISKFSEKEQEALKQTVLKERTACREYMFLKRMNSAPLQQRLNAQSDAEVIMEMEKWYTQCRRRLHERYLDLLWERQESLQAALDILERKAEAYPDLFNRGDPRSLVPKYQEMKSRELTTSKRETLDSRFKALAGAHNPGGYGLDRMKDRQRSSKVTSPPPSKPKKLKPLSRVDAALQQAGVTGNEPLALYMQHYYNGQLTEIPITPNKKGMARPEGVPTKHDRNRSVSPSPSKLPPAAECDDGGTEENAANGQHHASTDLSGPSSSASYRDDGSETSKETKEIPPLPPLNDTRPPSRCTDTPSAQPRDVHMPPSRPCTAGSKAAYSETSEAPGGDGGPERPPAAGSRPASAALAEGTANEEGKRPASAASASSKSYTPRSSEHRSTDDGYSSSSYSEGD